MEPAPVAVLDAEATRARLPFARLIPALREAFARDGETPPRQHLHPPGTDATLLLMPSWTAGERIGVKLVNVVPGNGGIGLPSVQAVYLLADFITGRWLALLDGNEITARRTAAVSALAASFLAPPEAETMLIVGSGRIARLLPEAHRVIRSGLRRFLIWNHHSEGAQALAAELQSQGLEATHATDLEIAVSQADIVSCATLSQAPLVRGAWLRPGTHLDLIGSFTPDMREADEEAVRFALVFIDSWEALEQSGDLRTAAGRALPRSRIQGRLTDLCREPLRGRADAHEITLFKSVGTATADLAAAGLALRNQGEAQPST